MWSALFTANSTGLSSQIQKRNELTRSQINMTVIPETVEHEDNEAGQPQDQQGQVVTSSSQFGS